ncbi:MAG TPA: 4Fe-4S binding protein [Myxococcota bacterium]|nr:4Fe-4S binding protein [Myxococcota bacterium]
MQGNYLPLWKLLDAPLISLDESHVELLSVLALMLLAMLALVAPRGRRQWIRHLVQLLSVMIFFYVVYSCLGVFGMVRNVIYGSTLIGTIFTESFFWMSLPLAVIAFSLTSGPYFCGWICPTGAFQELSAAVRERISRRLRRGIKDRTRVRPRWYNQILLALFFAGFLGLIFYLGTTKRFYVEDSSLYWASSLFLLIYLVLTRAVDDAAIRTLRGVSFTIIVVSTLFKTAIVSPVHFAFEDVSDPASALSTLALVVASLFISRAWCRYVCPWGYLMGCIQRVSRLRVQAGDDCKECGTCESVCRVGAIHAGRVEISECQFCLACIDKCPSNAIKVVDVWKKQGHA